MNANLYKTLICQQNTKQGRKHKSGVMVAEVLACPGGGSRASGELPFVPSMLAPGSSLYERASPDH